MALKRLRESVRFGFQSRPISGFIAPLLDFWLPVPTDAEPVVVPEKSLFLARRRPDDTVHRDEQDFPLGESEIRSQTPLVSARVFPTIHTRGHKP